MRLARAGLGADEAEVLCGSEGGLHVVDAPWTCQPWLALLGPVLLSGSVPVYFQRALVPGRVQVAEYAAVDSASVVAVTEVIANRPREAEPSPGQAPTQGRRCGRWIGRQRGRRSSAAGAEGTR